MTTEVLFWFFLVIGPLTAGTNAPGVIQVFETRQACWTAHAQMLAGKEATWLTQYLVTPCGPHPAVVAPRPDPPPPGGGGASDPPDRR